MGILMVSVSGIRGIVGNGLDPETLSRFTAAFASFAGSGKIILGSDGRISGDFVKRIVSGTLIAKGADVIDIGVCPTPSVLYNVRKLKAAGGIQISASHNPNEWNALKLINAEGEFMSPEENRQMLAINDEQIKDYVPWDKLGKHSLYKNGVKDHKNAVLGMKHVNAEEIKKRKFKVLLDCVNGAGSYIMQEFLEDLGCEVIPHNCEKNGIFPRLPEPIPENLRETMQAVKENNVDIGIVVDPDVDRLVLITEKGEPFSEENTVSLAVKFILSKEKGDVAVNLSTTRAVDDIADSYGVKVFRSPVGEANVVKKMKETGAVIGGEGSGGVIFPALQYGRDALVGTIITLQSLLEFGGTMSELKASLPEYYIAKRKIDISGKDPDNVLAMLKEKYSAENINKDDGLRVDFEDHWVHFRKSNTEPIIRCIAESGTEEKASRFADKYLEEVKSLL